MKQIRFGLFPEFSKESLPVEEWTQAAQIIEQLGYSSILQQDHFYTTAYDPIAILASAASVTKTIKIGSFVFSVDFRHPVILAKAAATIHLISKGRFEFGIGAGYQPDDYNMSGIPLDSPKKRVERLEEALRIIKSMWTEDSTSFTGKYYKVNEIERAGELQEGNYPKILIGAGGKKMLRLASEYADIVGIIPRWPGSWGKAIQLHTLDSIKSKIKRVKALAEEFGRNPDSIEFQMFIPFNEITKDSEHRRTRIDGITRNFGASSESIENSEYVMVGSSDYIRERISKLYRETGANYFVFNIRKDQHEEYARSIIQPLTKSP